MLKGTIKSLRPVGNNILAKVYVGSELISDPPIEPGGASIGTFVPRLMENEIPLVNVYKGAKIDDPCFVELDETEKTIVRLIADNE